MNAIAQWQAQFQAGLIGDPEPALPLLRVSPRVAPARLFGIYRHAYRARLVESLSQDFPGLAAMLGAAVFAELVRDYLAAHPSRYRSIRWVGHALPDFLAARGPSPLADMARLEWALLAAFDAPDETVIGRDALLAMPAEHWGALRFGLAKSAACLALPAAIVARHQRLVHDRDFDIAGIPEIADWLISRQDMMAQCRIMAADEAAAFRATAAGADFAAICDHVAAAGAGEEAAYRAAAILQTWIAAGLIVGLDLSGIPASLAI